MTPLPAELPAGPGALRPRVAAAAEERLAGLLPALAAAPTNGVADAPNAALRREAERSVSTFIDDLEAADPDRLRAEALEADIASLREALASGSAAPDYTTASAGVRRLRGLARDAAALDADRLRRWSRDIGGRLPALAAELGVLAAAAAEGERRVRDFFGISPRGFDLEAGEWKRIDWEGLEDAAGVLADWPAVAALADLLGRASAAPEPSVPERAAPVRDPGPLRHIVEALGRSEITGFTQGDDLAALPAFELALLADPDAESLFYKRHAAAGLTNLEYRTTAEHWLAARADAEVPSPPPAVQGPVIICVDTSGSMAGWPERVARALVLALTRRCLASGRGCYLIGFSSDIRCLDLSNPVAVLPELAAFLSRGFRGGTDLRPALAKSLELLDNPAWTKADLLIVSDFRVPKLLIKKSGLVEPIRERHAARLHACTVAPLPLSDDLNIFDTRWHFRVGTKGEPLGIAPGQFQEQKELFP